MLVDVAAAAKATDSHAILSMAWKCRTICGWAAATMVLSRAKRNVDDRIDRTSKNHRRPVTPRWGPTEAGCRAWSHAVVLENRTMVRGTRPSFSRVDSECIWSRQ